MKQAVVQVGTLAVHTFASSGQTVAPTFADEEDAFELVRFQRAPIDTLPSADSISERAATFITAVEPIDRSGAPTFKINGDVAMAPEPTPTILGALGLAFIAPRRRRA